MKRQLPDGTYQDHGPRRIRRHAYGHGPATAPVNGPAPTRTMRTGRSTGYLAQPWEARRAA